jgi:hypothetical protein
MSPGYEWRVPGKGIPPVHDLAVDETANAAGVSGQVNGSSKKAESIVRKTGFPSSLVPHAVRASVAATATVTAISGIHIDSMSTRIG